MAHRTQVNGERLAGWVSRFEARHGPLVVTVTADAVCLHAADGANARLINLWQPFPADIGLTAGLAWLTQPRQFAIMLVRKGASAVGVAFGDELVVHRVRRHYVQSRTKAGGWSQQRYARRRENQARSAYRKTADDAFEVLAPRCDELSFLVTGGDRAGIAEVLADQRLAPLAALAQHDRLGAIPDARLSVLAEVARQARAVPIELDAQAVAPTLPPAG